MAKIVLDTIINAPIEKVFDLSRSIDLHIESTKQTGEQAIAGRTSGLIELGETVTWRAKHFGIWQSLTSKITDYNYPVFFADEMVSGAFKSFRHEHHFSVVENGTLMRDIFVFESPLGVLGKFANWLFLKKYMTDLLIGRNRVIKLHAEQCNSFMKKNEVDLSFVIYDFNDINHDDITHILNILPGKVIVKGEKRNPNNPNSPLFTQNEWIMKSHLGKYAEFEDQMNDLLDIIESKLAEFKAICNKYHCEFSCAIFVYFDNGESTPWVHLNQRYNRINQELNIEFDVDLYVLPAKD